MPTVCISIPVGVTWCYVRVTPLISLHGLLSESDGIESNMSLLVCKKRLQNAAKQLTGRAKAAMFETSTSKPSTGKASRAKTPRAKLSKAHRSMAERGRPKTSTAKSPTAKRSADKRSRAKTSMAKSSMAKTSRAQQHRAMPTARKARNPRRVQSCSSDLNSSSTQFQEPVGEENRVMAESTVFESQCLPSSSAFGLQDMAERQCMSNYTMMECFGAMRLINTPPISPAITPLPWIRPPSVGYPQCMLDQSALATPQFAPGTVKTSITSPTQAAHGPTQALPSNPGKGKPAAQAVFNRPGQMQPFLQGHPTFGQIGLQGTSSVSTGHAMKRKQPFSSHRASGQAQEYRVLSTGHTCTANAPHTVPQSAAPDQTKLQLPKRHHSHPLVNINDGRSLVNINDGCSLVNINDGCSLVNINDGCSLVNINDGCSLVNINDGCSLVNINDGCSRPQTLARLPESAVLYAQQSPGHTPLSPPTIALGPPRPQLEKHHRPDPNVGKQVSYSDQTRPESAQLYPGQPSSLVSCPTTALDQPSPPTQQPHHACHVGSIEGCSCSRHNGSKSAVLHTRCPSGHVPQVRTQTSALGRRNHQVEKQPPSDLTPNTIEGYTRLSDIAHFTDLSHLRAADAALSEWQGDSPISNDQPTDDDGDDDLADGQIPHSFSSMLWQPATDFVMATDPLTSSLSVSSF